MSDKVLNEFEIQKIENIFRNSHLYTKNKIEITYTNVDNGSYPHINYDLIIDKKIHINLYASKNTYENEDEYLKKNQSDFLFGVYQLKNSCYSQPYKN